MVKWFVSSDIHSFFDIFYAELLKQGFEIDNPEHKVIICGDLMDRGDQTVKLFDFIKSLHSHNRLIYVRGNHESLLFDCMHEITCGRLPGYHHFSNGTIKTICQFCGENEWIIYDPTQRKKICDTMQPILDFIDKNCVDYAEIGSYVFVHGWIPCYQGLNDFRDATAEDWERARWENGMERWMNRKCRADSKTIVCGHYHCSWGWSHVRLERKEFPNKSRADWKKSFEPFVDDGIMAIDACTAYTNLCNVIVIEEDNTNGNN